MPFAHLNHWLVCLFLVFGASSCYRLEISELVKSGPSKPITFDDGSLTMNSATSPTLTWTASADPKRRGFQVAVGTQPGLSDLVEWTDVGETRSATLAGPFGGTDLYFGSIRAVGINGLASDVVSGAGFVYSPPPTYSFNFDQEDMLFDVKWTTSRLTGAGTYYDKNGIIRNGVANLLLQTENLMNGAWGKNNSTVTVPNTVTAPSDALNGNVVKPTSALNTHAVSTSASVTALQTYTASIFVKAGEYSQFTLSVGGTMTAASMTVDLNNPTVITTSGAPLGRKVTPSYNGWYRLELTAQAATSGSGTMALYILDENGLSSYSGNGVKAAYVWGGQFENSPAAGSYVSATSLKMYLPRLDHDPSNCVAGVCALRGFLMEDARTNQMNSSEDFSNAVDWPTTAATVQADATVSPDSKTTADLVQESTGANPSLAQTISTTVSSGFYSVSVFAKPSGRTRFQLSLSNAGGDQIASVFDLTGAGSTLCTTKTGLAPRVEAKVISLPNGWYRAEVRGKLSTSASTGVFRLSLVDQDCNTSYTGDGASGMFFWGAQGEAGYGASSYLRGGQGRGADLLYANQIGSWYNLTNGAFMMEMAPVFAAPSTNLYFGTIRFDDTVAGYNTHKLEIYGNNNYYGFDVYNGTYTFVPSSGRTVTEGVVARSAMSYSPTTASSAVMGDAGDPAALGLPLPNVNQMQLPGGSWSWLKSVKYWNSTLSPAQLHALTK